MIRLYVRTNGGTLSVFAESSPRRVVGVGVGHTHHARLLLAPWEAMRMIMRFTPCSIAAPLLPSLGASPWASHQNFPFSLTNLTYGQIWERKGGGRKLDKSSL